jgi:hypothetical protein
MVRFETLFSSFDIFKISGHGFHVKEMALIYGIPERTFYRRLKEIGISLKDKYSNITDTELEERVQDISIGNNVVGEKITRARLQYQGDTVQAVQRSRTRQAIQNTVGSRLWPPRLARREYSCRAALSVWHLTHRTAFTILLSCKQRILEKCCLTRNLNRLLNFKPKYKI